MCCLSLYIIWFTVYYFRPLLTPVSTTPPSLPASQFTVCTSRSLRSRVSVRGAFPKTPTLRYWRRKTGQVVTCFGIWNLLARLGVVREHTVLRRVLRRGEFWEGLCNRFSEEFLRGVLVVVLEGEGVLRRVLLSRRGFELPFEEYDP